MKSFLRLLRGINECQTSIGLTAVSLFAFSILQALYYRRLFRGDQGPISFDDRVNTYLQNYNIAAVQEDLKSFRDSENDWSVVAVELFLIWLVYMAVRRG